MWIVRDGEPRHGWWLIRRAAGAVGGKAGVATYTVGDKRKRPRCGGW